MEIDEFIKDTTVDNCVVSGYSGWGSGSGCFYGSSSDGFGSGKCIEWINGSGYGAGNGSGYGYRKCYGDGR